MFLVRLSPAFHKVFVPTCFKMVCPAGEEGEVLGLWQAGGLIVGVDRARTLSVAEANHSKLILRQPYY